MKGRWLWWGLMVMSLAGCGQSSLRNGAESKESLAQIYTNLGLAYMQQGNNDTALDKFLKALEQDADHADAHHYIASIYQQQGQLEKAEQHYQRALRLDAENPMLQNNYGTFLCERDQYPQAEKLFLDVAKNPRYNTPALAYENAGLCVLRARDAQKAERHFRAALEINSKLLGTLYQMALLMVNSGRPLPARAYLQRYSELVAPEPRSLWLGILIERKLGDAQAVANYSMRLKSNFPNTEEAQLLRESEKK